MSRGKASLATTDYIHLAAADMQPRGPVRQAAVDLGFQDSTDLHTTNPVRHGLCAMDVVHHRPFVPRDLHPADPRRLGLLKGARCGLGGSEL